MGRALRPETPGLGDDWPASVDAAAQVFVEDLGSLEVSSEDRHHLQKVLRLRPGEAVIASDGAGQWRRTRFVGAGGGRASSSAEGPGGRLLEADGEVVFCDMPTPVLTVAMVPTKGSRPEWAVQKLTETGVDRIALLHSERSVVQWQEGRASKALERLARVAREAAAQSRRPFLPELTGVMRLEELRERLAPVPLAVAQIGGGAPELALPAVAIGPEGGWSPAEVPSGIPLVGLGPTVLRSETAAVVAGALLCSLRAGLVSL